MSLTWTQFVHCIAIWRCSGHGTSPSLVFGEDWLWRLGCPRRAKIELKALTVAGQEKAQAHGISQGR